MFCGVCGNKLEDGAKFCNMCGSPVASESNEPANQGSLDSAFAPEENEEPAVPTGEEGTTVITADMLPGNGMTGDFGKKEEPAVQYGMHQPLTGQSAPNPPKNEPIYPQYNMPGNPPNGMQGNIPNMGPNGAGGSSLKNSVNFMTIGIIAVAAILVIVGAFLIFGKLIPALTSDKDNMIVYVSDNSLYYLKDYHKPDKALEVDRIKNLENVPYNAFSEDGKYIYYYSKYDSDEETYTLSRIKTSKLKKGRNNDKYIEDLAKGVTSFKLVGKDVYYLDENKKLVQIRKNKETTLAKDISSFDVSEDGKTVYYYTSSDKEDDIEIGCINAKNGKVTEIDDKISSVSDFSDTGYFVYYKDYEDGEYDLYTADKSGNVVKVAKGVASVVDIDFKDKEIYYTYSETEDKPMIDFVSYSEDDYNAKEPTVEDAFKSIKEKTAIKRIEGKSLTSEEKKEFYDNLSYDDETGYYTGYDYDNGGYLYYDKDAGQWYSVDQDKLDQLWDDYYAVSGIQDYIERLKEDKYTVYEYTLCKASFDGKEDKICDNITDVSIYGKDDLLLYKKVPTEYSKVDIKEAYDDGIYDKVSAIYNNSNEIYYRFGGSEEHKLDSDVSVYVDTFEDGKYVFKSSSDEEMVFYYTEKSGSSLKPLEKISDDFDSIDADFSNGELVFIGRKGDDTSLYRYNGNSIETIKDDVKNVSFMKTKEMLVNDDGDLDIYNKSGEKVESIRDVSGYFYMDKNDILFVSDDELYVYVGDGKSLEIADDVTDMSLYRYIYGDTQEECSLYSY